MDVSTGDVFALRESLTGAAATGDKLLMDRFREKVAALGAQATEDEVKAMRSETLVLVEEQVAHKLKLGERERERRRRRRQAEKRARRANR